MSDLNMVKGFLWDTTITDPDGTVVSHSQDWNRIPAAGLAFLIRARMRAPVPQTPMPAA